MFFTLRLMVQPVAMSVTVSVKQNSPDELPPSWPTRSISTNPGTFRSIRPRCGSGSGTCGACPTWCPSTSGRELGPFWSEVTIDRGRTDEINSAASLSLGDLAVAAKEGHHGHLWSNFMQDVYGADITVSVHGPHMVHTLRQ
jgi:hypothetical protein